MENAPRTNPVGLDKIMPILSLSVLLVTAVAGTAFFIFEQGYPTVIGLLILTLATRFRSQTAALGKYVEFLFVFCLIWYLIEGFGVKYPGSLIIILAGLVVLIFYEGPEWGKLYFGAGKTGANMRLALVTGVLILFAYGIIIYVRFSTVTNPVPVRAPLDVLLVLGLGFAFYLPIMEGAIFRSFFLQRAVTASGFVTGMMAQGLLYGFMAYRVGVPDGALGMALGSLLGIGMGYLVKRSDSIYPSLLAHFIVTLGVYSELAILGQS